MPTLPVTRVVLYKHGVGYFEREGVVEGDAPLTFSFAQSEVSDVLKSLTVLDLGGGHIEAVNYDSTKPLAQKLADIALNIPDRESLVALLPQLKGARIALKLRPGDEPTDGILLGVDTHSKETDHSVIKSVFVSVMTDSGDLWSFDLLELSSLRLLDEKMQRDLEYYLRTQLAAKKKEARTFTFFAAGTGRRTVRLSYVVAAPVWKATYRLLLNEDAPPQIQGWAVVDNVQEEDWDQVELTLVAGLPVSFVHDLYTPRYVERPTVEVKETTGVLPPEIAAGFSDEVLAEIPLGGHSVMRTMAVPALRRAPAAVEMARLSAPSSVPVQVRERQVGDLFEYKVERPVTIRRDQSALVPIVLKPFDGRPVLFYQKAARAGNPLRAVEFKNTTGLTLEGGPVTVLDGGSYAGEAMLDTLKPNEDRLVPYAVELAVRVTDSFDTHDEYVHRVTVRKGVLKAQFARVRQTTYTVASKSDKDQVLYLEHPREGKEFKLFDTPQPHEATDSAWRFRTVLPAGQTIRYVVKQKMLEAQRHSLAATGDSQIAAWLDQKYLDAATAQALQQALALRAQAADLTAAAGRLQAERDAVFKDQARVRENLASLGDKAGEKALRERFVTTLDKQETRLEAIAKELAAIEKDADAARAEVARLLAGLEYESTIS
ncbi:MAG: hypothetical protein U0746_14300 [Gemmataceae bacterium]